MLEARDGEHARLDLDDPDLGEDNDTTVRLICQVVVGHTNSVYGCAITPDGRRVVSASYDRTLRVWDLDTHECLMIHRGDAPFVSVAATAGAVAAGDHHGTVWFLEWPKR